MKTMTTMRKTILLSLAALATLVACNPITDETPLGGVANEKDLNINVYSTTSGGNQITMVNHTKGVGSYWDYIIGRAASDSVTVSLPFLGQQTIRFVGLCDGGTVETARTVNITTIDHPTDVTWSYFAGTGTAGKRWTWNRDVDACYGDGGWQAEWTPDWDPVAADNTDDPNGSMVFDLNGGPNVTIYDANGKSIAKGTFTFDMTDKLPQCDNGTDWGIGSLTLTGCTVLSGHLFGDTAPVYKYRILTINDHEMVLCAAPDGAAGWDAGTFWLFKSE